MADKGIDKWWYWFRIVGILILMSYFIFCDAPNQNPNGHFTICLFHIFTGYPCPGCGTVRGLKYFFHLDFYNALMMNPIAVIIGIYMIVCLVWTSIDLIRGKETFDSFFHFKLNWKIFVVLAVLLAANWWWNIEKGV
ncbi:MAG: DUF2752 domain-containing protein [Bacteroidales bacterium]|nr:DUF2752 domain-containing protein [Bacteroidales bacterium]